MRNLPRPGRLELDSGLLRELIDRICNKSLAY